MTQKQKFSTAFLTQLLACSRELQRLYHLPEMPQQLLLQTHLYRYAHYFDTGIRGHNCTWCQATARGFLEAKEIELFTRFATVLEQPGLLELLSKLEPFIACGGEAAPWADGTIDLLDTPYDR